MPPIVIAGALAAGGALAGGVISSAGQAKANEANIEQAGINREFQQDSADKQMDYQERMSNTAYQRGVVDMRAAGINPILAADRGGASTPVGASASGAQATVENEGEGIGEGVVAASAMGLKTLEAGSTMNLQSAQAVQAGTQSALNRALAEKALAEAGYTRSTARSAKVDADVAETSAPMRGGMSWFNEFVKNVMGRGK